MVYAFSVFSHLPEQLHLQWLRELRRITRSGAVLVLTVQGPTLFDTTTKGPTHGLVPSAARARADRGRLIEQGFLLYSDRELLQKSTNEAYGSTWITPDYIRRSWARIFEIITVLEAPDGHQDYIVLRRT